ncbi:MAG: T9SS type A sorting domain-containing protein [Calditrichia bacterium]
MRYFFGLSAFAFLLLSQTIFAAPVQSDTIRVLGIRVEFKVDDAKTTSGDGKFNLSQPSGPYQIDPPPHNRSYFQDHMIALRNYFRKVSGGKLVIEGDVYPEQQDAAYQLPNQMTYYNPNTTPDQINTGLANLMRDAFGSADVDPAIDFSKYQSFVVFHAGVGKDVELGADETPQDIPSLFITQKFLDTYLNQKPILVDDGTVQIKNGMLIPETETQEGIELGLNGIFASNFGSQLGWPDLFSPETRRSGIGRFGLMDAGLFNGDGLLPAVPCAWTRTYAGWSEPINIYYSPNDELQIHPPLSPSRENLYRVPINEKEYFLVENRYSGKYKLDSLQYELSQGRDVYPSMKEVLLLPELADQVTFSDSTGVLIDVKNPDLGLSGNGCLIWHIDENVIEQNLATNTINADPEHRGVDLDEADGSQDIGQEFDFLSAGAGSENGWILDMWYKGNDAPLFKNRFSPNSVPNSRSYYNRANSHITISDFSAPDSVMSFRVNFDIYQQNFPRAINPQTYGRITSLKVSDLDFTGENDLILTTDRSKILVVSKSGESVWGSDSLEIAELPGKILPPPALFSVPTAAGNQVKALVALTTDGGVFGFRFTGTTFDTLFDAFKLSSAITTFPTVFYDADRIPNVVWGTEAGRVYRMNIADADSPPDTSAYAVGEAVKFLHVNGDNQIIAVTVSGKVYRNDQLIGQTGLPYFSPVGNSAAALTRNGEFLSLEQPVSQGAESGLFRFDSPMISYLFDENSENPVYFVAGNNNLYSFNYNYTLSDNFPVPIYKPARNISLALSPLLGKFFNSGQAEEYGIVVADPAGLIDGFDLQAKQLSDFPLALGDSLTVTPALLDIDGDKDVEIAAGDRNGILYIWDLAAQFYPQGWNQLYSDESNSNRPLAPSGTVPPVEQTKYAQLLPKERVYNWPNPNTRDFTFIRYYLTEQAQVSIKIYDLAGDLVNEFPGSGDALTANEVRWNLQDVQSGVYFARVHAKSSSRDETRIIKIAVVK